MPTKRPTTIAAYIRDAAPVAQPHLRKLHKLLQSVAPKAEETIKWGVPFFIEHSDLALYTTLRGSWCLTHVGTEGFGTRTTVRPAARRNASRSMSCAGGGK